MSNIFNEHFRDFIKALNDNKVEYVLVGGLAVILHGYVRGTGDMDVWVNNTKDNTGNWLKHLDSLACLYLT